MPKLIPEVGPSSGPHGQEPTSSPSSPTKATADPNDGIVVGTSRSTRDQDSENDANHSGASSDSDISRENVADSNMESASGDYITCSAQIQLALGLLTRSTGRGYRPPVV